MFQFSRRFAFLSTFRLSNRTPKITRILTLYQANRITLMPFSKAGTILIKICMNVRVTLLGSL